MLFVPVHLCVTMASSQALGWKDCLAFKVQGWQSGDLDSIPGSLSHFLRGLG